MELAPISQSQITVVSEGGGLFGGIDLKYFDLSKVDEIMKAPG